MGYNDARRFPDFSYISKTGKFNTAIDCVIITHLYAFILEFLSYNSKSSYSFSF